MQFSLYSEKLKDSLRKRQRGRKGERWRKQEKKKKKQEKFTTFCKLLIMVKKKKKAQRAQENVINYDEAQRNKNMPDYTVSGV